MNASENRRVHVTGKLGIAYFFNVVILVVKILVDGGSRVVGGIEDGSHFDDVGSAKSSLSRGPAEFQGPRLDLHARHQGRGVQ